MNKKELVELEYDLKMLASGKKLFVQELTDSRIDNIINKLKESQKYKKTLYETKEKLEELAGTADNPRKQTLEGNFKLYEIVTRVLKK